MYNSYEGAHFEIMRKCPYARNSTGTALVSACNGNYTNCNIPNCPRRLV